jgi:uncharacterized protein (DUF1778 family)
MAVITKKEEAGRSRLNIRISSDVKSRISRAAHILGQDLTEFTVSTLNEKAREVLERNERFELSEAEKAAFFEILDTPIPDPTENSLRAAKKYRRMIKKNSLRV